MAGGKTVYPSENFCLPHTSNPEHQSTRIPLEVFLASPALPATRVAPWGSCLGNLLQKSHGLASNLLSCLFGEREIDHLLGRAFTLQTKARAISEGLRFRFARMQWMIEPIPQLDSPLPRFLQDFLLVPDTYGVAQQHRIGILHHAKHWKTAAAECIVVH